MSRESLDRFPLLYESLHGLAEARVIVVPLATGNFSYVVLESADVNGTKKVYFAPSEIVYANIQGKNNGVGDAGARIVVTDVSTGAELTRIGTEVVAPGATFKVTAVKIGIMPSRDWSLKFDMTP